IFFFNDTATTEIYTLSLHDALPIWRGGAPGSRVRDRHQKRRLLRRLRRLFRSEEHTSELQSHSDLVWRPLLEKRHAPPPPHTPASASQRPAGRCAASAAA